MRRTVGRGTPGTGPGHPPPGSVVPRPARPARRAAWQRGGMTAAEHPSGGQGGIAELVPVAAADALWLELASTTNLPIVTALFELERSPTADAVAGIAAHLARAPMLRRRVVRAGRRLHWLPATPDPAAHLEVRDCASWQEELGRVLATDLDASRPLWRLYLLRDPHRVVLAARLHHSLGDGNALVAALLDVAGVRPAAEASRPGRFAARVRAVLDVPAAGVRLLARRAEPRPLKRALSGVKHARLSGPFPLPALLAAARARGVTLNDLLSGALGSALAATVGEGEALTAAAPVSLRRRRLSGRAGGNQLGIVLLALPTGEVEAAVRTAAGYLRRVKRSGEALAVNLASRAAALVPGGAVRLVAGVLSRRSSLVFSNVVGPSSPVRVGGVGVAGLSFLVPQVGDLALGVAVLSYAGRVRVGFSADAAAVPDLDALVGAFEERVAALVGAGGPAGAGAG